MADRTRLHNLSVQELHSRVLFEDAGRYHRPILDHGKAVALALDRQAAILSAMKQPDGVVERSLS